MTTPQPRQRAGSSAGGTIVAPPLPTGRRTVLYAVRELGDATADQVAAELDMTASGARQHLVALEEAGLIAVSNEPASPPGNATLGSAEPAPRPGNGRRRGRPTVTYHVTELADALFPKAYAALANELLGYLDDRGVVDDLFARRREERIKRAARRLAPLGSFRAKVFELARILDDDGYMASAQEQGRGRFVLVEHNCAIADVARRYGQACSSEIEFLRAVLPEAQIERTSHMVEGARHCAYTIDAYTIDRRQA